MNQFQNAIITASAGTGKTYRLSIEFLSLILKYYEHPDFKLDSILALTFTRKATAEIRERIMSHMESLIQKKDRDLINSLRQHVPGDPESLSMREENILLSAYNEINRDLQNLQIMTIDSYTANIFRNIVRPMKSIDEYEVDQDAIKKSMPLLMNHLMKPQFRARVDKLLSRKVHRSLDDYTDFFASMIYNRWLYFLITARCKLQRDYLQEPRKDIVAALRRFATALQENIKAPDKKSFVDTLLSDIKKVFTRFPENPDEFCEMLGGLLKDPTDALNLYSVLKKDVFSKNTIIKDAHALCNGLQTELLEALAEDIYHNYYLPEEAEILDVWSIILEEYDKLIYRYKKLNYQDIAWITFEALFSNDPPEFKFNDENSANEFYMFLSHRTRFMLIDEFQDTSLIQFNMLRPIMEEISAGFGSKDFGGLVVVGDEKQSIFGWRGGERDLLLNLNRIIPPLYNLSPEPLTQSWRSSRDMLDFINDAFLSPDLHGALAEGKMNWPYQRVDSALGDLDTLIEVASKGYSNYYGTGGEVFEYFVDQMIIPELEKLQDKPHVSVAILCRKTSQLSRLQLLLEERGKTGIFQPSAPLTVHRLVAPLVSWLRFVAYGGWLDFLAYLRSDYLLLKSHGLKKIVDEIALWEKAEAPCTEMFEQFPPVAELNRLAKAQRRLAPYAIIREISALCLNQEEAIPKRDLTNLQAFLNIAAAWELKDASRGAKITDFLDYLQDNENQEGFTQVSVEGSGGIQLLTFHKSKGLQFDKVFVYCDLSPQSGSEKKLFWASDYLDHEFRYIKDYSLSFHFSNILPHSPARELWENKQRQAKLEELNNLYVAFTRAKTDLHILFTYNGSKSWEEYLEEKMSAASLPLLLAKACTDQFGPENITPCGVWRKNTEYFSQNSSGKEEDGVKPLSFEEIKLADTALPLLDRALAKPPEELDFKAVYLEKRQALYGDLAHYYLSYILRDEDAEHVRASCETIRRFGSLLSLGKIHRLIESLREEIRLHSYLFDPEFDKVFCEFAIGDYRVDRLMVNTKAGLALIIDYKTGSIHDKDQLETYQKALAKHPALQAYSFRSEYIMLTSCSKLL